MWQISTERAAHNSTEPLFTSRTFRDKVRIMKRGRPSQFRFIASAAVVLAAAVNAAAATAPAMVASESAAPGLALPAQQRVQSARAFLAQKAARTIRSLDRISGAQPIQFKIQNSKFKTIALPQLSQP